jgi:AraC-like DNA-binding protein
VRDRSRPSESQYSGPGVGYQDDGIIRIASTTSVHLGSERRPPGAPGWDGEQRTSEFDVIAFSLRPVRVRFEDEPEVMLCPGVVALPGAVTAYRRIPACPSGQRTIFFSIRSHRLYGESSRRSVAVADPVALALACRLDQVVFRRDPDALPDALLIDEVTAEIVDRTLRPGEVAPVWRSPSPGTDRVWKAMANQVASELSSPCPPTLDQMADIHEVSPAYLARIFRHEFGQTMHHCFRAARLARAIERLPDMSGRLTEAALASGFASHAHFTRECRVMLGVTPSQLGTDTLRELIHRVRQIGPAAGRMG